MRLQPANKQFALKLKLQALPVIRRLAPGEPLPSALPSFSYVEEALGACYHLQARCKRAFRNPRPPTGEPSVLDRTLECFWSKLMEVKLESMVNHLVQACAFRRA